MTIIAVGADHAGYRLKEVLADHLRGSGHEVLDLGTSSEDRVDYPDFGEAVGRAVAGGEATCGLCVCGSGIGIAMAAGKVTGIRAATVHDVTSARLARQHNDANVICIGARFLGEQTAVDAVDAYLVASFEQGRHTGRVAKINALDGVD
ncbi:MAG: ribose 5-phosphate isomerase B [Actinomycetota bacterium]|nr:ribose 5-phosphate isomerase B [Actinomycetota bacterium]